MKTAFVTGGSSGIGQEIIRALREQRWDVIAPAHRQLDLAKLDALNERAGEIVKDAPAA